MRQKETSLLLKLGTAVKHRAFDDWHIQRVPCQSCAQSISSSQSVLFVCWICFGTCRPLIDMGAGAGKTLLWCEANSSPSVTRPQMFGLRGNTGIILVQRSGHSLSLVLYLTPPFSLNSSCRIPNVIVALKLSFNSEPGLLTDLLCVFLVGSASTCFCYIETRSSNFLHGQSSWADLAKCKQLLQFGIWV